MFPKRFLVLLTVLLEVHLCLCVCMCTHTHMQAKQHLCVRASQGDSILQVSYTVLPWNKEYFKSLGTRGNCPWATYSFSPLIKQQ